MNDLKKQKKVLLTEFMKEYEHFCFEKTDVKSYAARSRQIAEKLVEMCPEEPVYRLMEASVYITRGKNEEAEKILKKYERNHVLQFRNAEFRACFLYLAGKLTEDKLQRKNIVIQLQKLYQKNPMLPSLYWYLTRLDESFEKNPEKKIAFLEKQWKLGCKQNLLYMEVIRTLREHPEAAGNMDDFLMQCYIWAQRRGVISKDMGAQIAKHAMKLKQCEKRYEYLLRECYRFFATKELLAALCSLYIRAGRTDRMAALYYSKGVEFELNLNNLYEYYMMATTEQKNCLLPEQVLLYFLYHDKLSSAQKAYLYKNIVKYGDPKSEIYEKYSDKIEKYTIESLLKRRISPEHAYLYEEVLHPEIFTAEMAEAMADLMFLRKVICTDPRMKEVQVSYPQLATVQRVPLKKHHAYVSIYSPAAVVTLADEVGNLYRNTVSYQMDKVLDERKYIEVCKQYAKSHVGILLYLCGKKADQVHITEENVEYYRHVPDLKGFQEDYRNTVLLRLSEYAAAKKTLEELPDSWFDTDGKTMSKDQRGKMISYLVQKKRYEDAYSWLETYGTVYVPAATILKVVTALADSEKAESELYYRLCYGCFQNGQVNYTSLKYLAGTFLGTCEQMAELWKQARAHGVKTHELEERILVQMMFTGAEIGNHFEIYLSYNQRETNESVKRAYLTYFSREHFVKNKNLDNRFYFLLEEELLNNPGYTEICKLSYLKYLSEKEQLSARQKALAVSYLKDFFSKKICYGFMRNFGEMIPEALILEDKLFVEYYAPESSEVVLHYKIEKEKTPEWNYRTLRLYPSYGGVFSKGFTLFEGEMISYFFTEKKENGTEKRTETVTETVTETMMAQNLNSNTKYCRINRLRRLCEEGKREKFTKEFFDYRYLEMAAEQLFEME